MKFEFEPVEPFAQNDHVIYRSACLIEGTPLVLIHKRGQTQIDDDPTCFLRMLQIAEIQPVIPLEDNNWTWSQACPTNFNCHALAIGSQVGLTPDDWLEGSASLVTLHVNPAQLILDRCFQEVDSQVNDDDVVVLRDTKLDNLVHSGFLKTLDGTQYVVSKFGEGPVCLTTFQVLAEIYKTRFDKLQFFRKKQPCNSIDAAEEPGTIPIRRPHFASRSAKRVPIKRRRQATVRRS